MHVLKLIRLLVQEALARRPIMRVPEPSLVMNEPGQIEAFHQQGGEALLPVYHFNALATSRLTPRGGTVLDLGSGSARYLAYLAERRPDLNIIGIELAPDMAALGRQHLKALGLSHRVELRLGDMTTVSSLVTERIDTISSVFSLHHLPSLDSVATCIQEMRQLRERDGSAIWVFDFARPRRLSGAELFSSVFTPNAHAVFNEDTKHSLVAALSFSELRSEFAAACLESGQHHLSRWMRLYQTHVFPGQAASCAEAAWNPGQLSADSLKNWRGLRNLFPAHA